MKYSKRRLRRNNKSKKIKKRYKGGNNNIVYIIKIWAEWCGHCKTLNEIWDIIKDQVKDKNIEFIELEDNEIKNGALSKLNKRLNLIGKNEIIIDGYPTLVKINKGKMEKYEGIRDVSSLVNWINHN
jgi:thiol-disulfide isomerase/thioredoxin